MNLKYLFCVVACLFFLAAPRELLSQTNNRPNFDKFLVVVECAIECEGKLLIIERPPGVHAANLLAFPGGKVEYVDGQSNEILTQAIKREIYEELGIQLEGPFRFITTSYFRNSDNVHVLDLLFHTQLDEIPLEVFPSSREIYDYSWMTAKEVVEQPNCPEWMQRQVSHIVDQEVCGPTNF